MLRRERCSPPGRGGHPGPGALALEPLADLHQPGVGQDLEVPREVPIRGAQRVPEVREIGPPCLRQNRQDGQPDSLVHHVVEVDGRVAHAWPPGADLRNRVPATMNVTA